MNLIYVLPLKLFLVQFILIFVSLTLSCLFGDMAGVFALVILNIVCYLYFYGKDKNVIS